MPWFADGNRIAAIARGQNGQPGNTYWDWYGTGPVFWCCEYVLWDCEQAGTPFPDHTAWVPDVEDYAKANNQWLPPSAVPPVGSFVLYDWDRDGLADHIGVYLGEANDGSGYIIASEGDAGDGTIYSRRVDIFQRSRSLVAGFVAPVPINVQPSEEDELMAAKDEIIGAVSAKIDDLSRQIATATNLEINADADVIRQLSAASEAAKSNIVAYLAAVDKQDTDAAVSAVAEMLKHATAGG